jgi:hypothetical protein
MKHLLNDLTSEERSKILEQHTGGMNLSIDNFNTLVNNKLGDVKPLVNEDNLQGGGFGGGSGAGKRPTGSYKVDTERAIQQNYNFDKSKMKTGSDDVDITNPEYAKLATQLGMMLKNKNIKGPITISVTGGASAVGSAQGYDNNALAQRRADKLIAQLRKDVPNLGSKFKFTTKTKVGGEKKLNSPEAYKEQFVKVDFNYADIQNARSVIELDNTAVAPYVPGRGIKDDGDDDWDFPDVKIKRVCIRIPENLVEEYRVMLRKFKADNGLKEIPFGIYDVK